MRYRYLKPFQADVVHAWWRALQPQDTGESTIVQNEAPLQTMRPFWFDRGPRARLRRAASLTDLEAESACFALRDRLGEMRTGWLDTHDAIWLPLLAGAVAQVQMDTPEDRTLALALGRSATVNDTPPMSDLRFRRLLQEDEPEPFYRQLRRALQLASGKVNAARLADDLLAWCAERDLPQRPAEAMHYRWARDYFLDRKDQKLVAQNGAAALANNSQETTA